MSEVQEQSWETFLAQPSVDDQPEVESEEVVETEVTDEVVEPDSDETTEEETEETTEEESEEDTEEEKPLFDDDTDIDLGEGRQPVKLSELKNGYLRQSDYTKKTQTLAEEKKAFESEQEAIKPYQEFKQFIDQNPYPMQVFNKLIEQWQHGGEPVSIEEALDSEAGPYLNHLLSENKRLQSELEQTKGQYESTQFETNMSTLLTDLKAEYGDLVTSEYESTLRTQAKEEGLSVDVLKRIAKGDLAEQKLKQEKESAKKAEAKTKQKMRETKLPPQPKNKGNSPAPKEIDLDGSWLDTFKQVGG